MNTARDLQRFSYAFNLSVLRTRMFKQYFVNNCRQKSSKKFERTEKDFTNLIQPRSVNPRLYNHDMDVGSELSGKLKKDKVLQILNNFYRRQNIKTLAAEHGLDKQLFHKTYVNFRSFVSKSESLPVDLHIVMSDILQEAGHVDDLFPYFLNHAREIFPHLDCMDDLRKISDLRLPANWYPVARGIQRKIIFHAGPTNSGKTHHALESFLSADNGIYCGPLKLLASEVFLKSNAAGTPCDLVTGEERRFANDGDEPSNHISCTVEMASVSTSYGVAVIDEIQMVRDQQRGWAWTRVLLGICAREVHLCGESSAIDLVKELIEDMGDEMEVRRYKRLTKLHYLNAAVEKFSNIHPGDCVVCFNKNDIFYISQQLDKLDIETAVIYGGLPPGTKLAQAAKFNDPLDPCKVMVATDAIGMGLNLAIKRVIFYSLMKPQLLESGEKEMNVISTSQALQIGGRAGRYNTVYENGEVTTFRADDLQLLHDIVGEVVEPIEQAGLHPTADQIELFAYHLPHATLSNLVDIFVTLSQLDSDNYFMCTIEDFKFLADMIEHISLNLRVRYVFCCAPIPKKQPFVCTMFLKFARQFSRNEPLTLDWLCRQVGWPFATPSVIADLVHLEAIFDVFDLYLWLSYRFQDMFPDVEHVRELQRELDLIIQSGVSNITRLIKASHGGGFSTSSIDVEDDFDIKRRQQKLVISRQKFDCSDDGYLPLKKNNSVHGAGASVKARQKSHGNARVDVGQGRLANELVKKGLLTPELVNQLRDEWQRTEDSCLNVRKAKTEMMEAASEVEDLVYDRDSDSDSSN